MTDKSEVTPPGLASDPYLFSVMTEINMISHMGDMEFERLLPDDLTQAQFGVLNRLIRLNTTETVSQLAVAFQVTQPTMSSTLKKLTAKALVTFEPHPADGRAKIVVVTEKGREKRNAIVKNTTPEIINFSKDLPDLDWDRLSAELGLLRKFFEDRVPKQ